MPTPKEGYFTEGGTRVPGVTTVIGRFKDSGGLIHWAWNQGRQGLDYRKTRDAAADAGTLAHRLVELYTTGERSVRLHETAKDLGISDASSIAGGKAGFEAFINWSRNNRIRVTPCERPLVSQKHRFGGTPDAIGEDGNGFSLIDYKTGGVYVDTLLQVAAYRLLWEENFPDKPITSGFHILRFSREHGDFTHRYFPEIRGARSAFLYERKLYDIIKRLEKRIK